MTATRRNATILRVNEVVEHHALIPHFKLLMIAITTGVAFLLASMYGPLGPTAVATALGSANADKLAKVVEIVDMRDTKAVEKYLREQYADTPLLVEIARCESTFNQFDKNGKLIRGRITNKDVGVLQINEWYHAETAEELGYDLHTIEGNVQYAKYLYEKFGSKPWKASSKCWAKRSA